MLIFISINIYGQQVSINSCKMLNGYWGAWQSNFGEVLQGTYDEFIIYNHQYHPSNYIMKVKIFGMQVEIDKKIKKKRIKEKRWYEYVGTVEYFTNISYPDFKAQFNLWPSGILAPKAAENSSHSNSRSATIKIQPYKKNPEVYNIFFEDYGIGIQLQ